MIILKFYFSLMPLLLNYCDTSKNDIVIIGRAEDDKEGAMVISNRDKKSYFVEGIDSWEDVGVVQGKQVKVWGRLLIEDLKEKIQGKSPKPGVPPPPIPQQMIGIKRTILNAKWKLKK